MKLIEQARLYVQAIRNFDLIVTEEATRAGWTYDQDEGKRVRRPYADWIGLKMAEFVALDNPVMIANQLRAIGNAAYAFVSLVDRGLTNGFVKQGQGLVAKWQTAERDRQELRQRLSEAERRLKDFGDQVVELETQNQKLRELNPVLGIVQGPVDEVADDTSKKKVTK